MTKGDRALLVFAILAVLGLACVQVCLRGEHAALRAEDALAQGRYLEASAHAQEASRSWSPVASVRGRAEAVLIQVSKHADDAHDPSLRTIAERALASARIESEWLHTAGPRNRVHGRPSWLSVIFMALGAIAALATLRLGKRWPAAMVMSLACCALGYLLPL